MDYFFDYTSQITNQFIDPKKRVFLFYILISILIAAAWFIMTPITANTVIIFSFAMGFLWLATVPLTSGLVAHIYGLKYMATLYGIVFFSHQLGSFVGVYLGGVLYDMSNSYTTVWWIGIAVGVFSSLIHLPVKEEFRLTKPEPSPA